MKKYVPILLAAVFWFIIFSPWTKEYVNFWLGMVISTSILTTLSFYINRMNFYTLYKFNLNHLFIGIISAITLYLIFYIGDIISATLFSFARPQVISIYASKSQSSLYLISFLLLFLIGPAEEIFWRGFIQNGFNEKWGDVKGLIITSIIYAFVHVWSFNFMLIMAALICGFFWGLIFNKYKSTWPVIISHSLWDLAIFIIIPI